MCAFEYRQRGSKYLTNEYSSVTSKVGSAPIHIMSSSNLELHTVVGASIHEEICKSEHQMQSAWWTRYRTLQDKKFAASIGALPPKVPKVYTAEQTGRKEFGPNSVSGVTDRDRSMMSTKQLDAYLQQASTLYEVVLNGSATTKPYNRRPMPSYYGATLHSSSADGTDPSSRAH